MPARSIPALLRKQTCWGLMFASQTNGPGKQSLPARKAVEFAKQTQAPKSSQIKKDKTRLPDDSGRRAKCIEITQRVIGLKLNTGHSSM